MNLTNLFDHQRGKQGFVTVMNVLLKDVETGEPMLKLDSLKISNINVEGNEKEIRGGLGAGLLMTYGYGRTATVEIEDAFASMDSMQYLFGSSSILEGAEVTYSINETITTDNVGAGELSKVSQLVADSVFGIDASGTKVYYDSGVWYSDEGTSTALSAVTVIDAFYEATGTGDEKAIVLKSTDFPDAVRMIGHTFLIDEEAGKKILCEIEFPKFKLDPSFALSLEGEGDASTFNFTGKALENDDNEIFKLKFIGDYDDLTSI